LQLAGLGGLVTVVTPKIFQPSAPKPTGVPKPILLPKPISLQSFNFDVVTVDERGKEINRRSGQAKFFTEDLGNGMALEMVAIPAGSFKMGSPVWEKGRSEEGLQHTVNVPTFFIGRFAVTQEQYQQVMGNNPFDFKVAKHPLVHVSWYDAVEFCKKLSQKTGREYRFPSEAEWEYACRAGTTTPFHFGETITGELANYAASATYASEPEGEFRKQTTPVGHFLPNAFGLHDMHGNIWEWCADTWHDNYNGAPTDGSAWTSSGGVSRSPVRDRVLPAYTLAPVRGGSWEDYPYHCRSAYREYVERDRDSLDYNFGFRVACGVARTS
jgi:formylglycine-generating enzyme required for sulfatase activity